MSTKYKHPKFSIGNETNKNPFKAINAAFTEHYPSYYKNHLTEIFAHAQKLKAYKGLKTIEAKKFRQSIVDFIHIAYYIYEKKILVPNYVQNNYRKLDCLLNQSDQIIHKWGSRILMLSKEQIDKSYESFKTIFEVWDLEELKSSICFVFEESIKDSIGDATYSFNLVKLYHAINIIIEVCFVIYYKNIVKYDIPNSYLLPQQKSSR